MPPHPHRPAELAWQVFRGSDVVRRGLLTRHQLRGASWFRLRHDVYADARLDRDHALACRAALLRLPPGTLIAGPSAAYLHGVEHAASFADDVHVLLPPTARADAQPGIRVHRIRPDVSPTCAGLLDVGSSATNSAVRTSNDRTAGGTDRPVDDARPFRPVPTSALATTARPVRRTAPPAVRQPGRVGGDHLRPGPLSLLPRSAPAACAWETAVWADPVRAVGVIDALLAQGLVSRGALADLADRNGGRPGGRRASWVFGLADPAAQSPPESHLRVRLVLAGLPRPVAQHPIRLASGLVLRPDLAWPQFRVAVEYDGTWHADADQLHRDRQRLNQFVGAGWVVLHVTSRRLHRDFAAVVREVRAALVAQGWRA
ncbi:hypothetical protein ONA91_01100 [Micromonospora sp. DR5-3]|uniref:hypothetical protein n=1 Tax=unclassified Micromonospora TaxID=2617518 RepID=UPI0011D9E27C|nr:MULTISPECIES: hypothetical protein [unclassified Micromonospora]MCW3813055.1 hypothetical protein [Micromonospora sp. DR5-3]TYC25958.1 hypothetical protein FXF52_00870 [Micromonospora sp. MP36]